MIPQTRRPDTIAICICSYERPRSLARCLASLEHLDLDGLGDSAVRIVVVDNSPGGTAAPVVAAHAARSRFRTTSVHEPRKGLSRARNAALAAVREGGEAGLAFIDDDEVATPGWLAALREAIARTGAAAAVGPVHPIFERPPPTWALRGGFFADVDPEGDDFAREGRTNNVLVATAAVAAAGLAFDSAYDDLGGEDTAFFRALAAKGGRIAVARDALVHEFVPPERVAIARLVRRWYRTGGLEARTQPQGHTSAGGRVRAVARGLARIGAGGGLALTALALHGRRDPSRVVARLFTVARGAGLVASAFGVESREYAKPRIETPHDARGLG